MKNMKELLEDMKDRLKDLNILFNSFGRGKCRKWWRICI